ncbi:MAG: c-type cytochrome [Gemmatimonadaceae bacterium]|jgi:cytochrome c oxidase cbb3-type subunit 3|nr:c-type cytochrome [Gemmatimonadaceae bacterium]
MEQIVKDNAGPRLIEHQYDGIQEYDNPMPRWWLGTFYATIIFSVIYLFNVGPVGIGKGLIGEYEADVARAAARTPPPANGGATDANALLALSKDNAALAEGKQVFITNCAACHAADGGGNIGPNLADNFWLHGGRIEDIDRTIRAGVLAKGMPAWDKLLKPAQLDRVVAFVYALGGTTPAKPKAPEGVEAAAAPTGGQ